MIFNTGAALLDTIVLSVVSKESQGTYGYKITQDVRIALDVSESTLYPVLRRLLKDNCLETYDQEYGGRNRRYYKITAEGQAQLEMYRSEWYEYVQKINTIIEGGAMMNRKEFIKKLDYLLQDIEDIEREEALQYYEDYFDEAGSENESQVINDLGSPERVAAIIKAGLENQFEQDIEYSEKGMGNANYKEAREVIEAEVIDNDKKKRHFEGNPDRNKILIILIIIGVIFLALPVGGGLFGVCIGVMAALFALGIGVLTGGVACLVGAIVCFVKGIIILAATPGMGLIILAAGFGLIALSIGFFALARGVIKAIPLMVSGIVNLIKTVIQKVGELL